MTETHSHALPSQRANPRTIFRDTALVQPRKTFLHPANSGAFTQVQSEDRVSTGILFGLAALMLPTLAYAAMQMWPLVSGDSLEHAIRAFLP